MVGGKNQTFIGDVSVFTRESTIDAVFLILYKELYYRHVYAKLSPTIDDRINSYINYCDLFNYILSKCKPFAPASSSWANPAGTSIDLSEGPSDLELPNQWLWDIIDEFIYQFQSFCAYRSKVRSKNEAEIDLLRDRPDVRYQFNAWERFGPGHVH